MLLNTGTADCKNGAEPEAVVDRVRELLELSWSESRFSSVVLSAIIPRGDDEEVEACVQEMNKGLESLVQEQQELSHKAVYVDFAAEDIALDDQGFPTEEGYEAMAGMWFDGIDDAAKRGWVETPEESAPPEVPEVDEEEKGEEEGEGEEEREGEDDEATAPSTTAPPDEAPTSTSVTDDAVDEAASRVLSGSDPLEGQNKRRQEADTTSLPEQTAPPASIPTEELEGGLAGVLDLIEKFKGEVEGQVERRQDNPSDVPAPPPEAPKPTESV